MSIKCSYTWNIAVNILPTFSKRTYYENISTPFLIKCSNQSKIIEHFQKWNTVYTTVVLKHCLNKDKFNQTGSQHFPTHFNVVDKLLIRYKYLIKQVSWDRQLTNWTCASPKFYLILFYFIHNNVIYLPQLLHFWSLGGLLQPIYQKNETNLISKLSTNYALSYNK